MLFSDFAYCLLLICLFVNGQTILNYGTDSTNRKRGRTEGEYVHHTTWRAETAREERIHHQHGFDEKVCEMLWDRAKKLGQHVN